MLNAVELVLYGLYAMIIYNHSVPTTGGTGIQTSEGVSKFLAGGRKVRGKTGNRALVIGFAAAVMTLSKTVLYCTCACDTWSNDGLTIVDFNEYFSGFANVGHNDWATLLFFYGIMK